MVFQDWEMVLEGRMEINKSIVINGTTWNLIFVWKTPIGEILSVETESVQLTEYV